MQSVIDRKALIMAEFKTYPPESMPVYELMYFSDLAFSIREERKKAARDGLVYHG